MNGFEIKVSRSDWQKELADPSKAEAVCKYCDRWWIVAGAVGIVRLEELPPTWGLMQPKGNGLTIVKHAPDLKPIPFDRHFMAAVMRRAAEQSVDVAALEKARKDGMAVGEASARDSRAYEFARIKGDLERLQEKVRAFEEASGVSISQRWEKGEKIGQAVKTVLEGEHKQEPRKLAAIRKVCRGILKSLSPMAPELDAIDEDA